MARLRLNHPEIGRRVIRIRVQPQCSFIQFSRLRRRFSFLVIVSQRDKYLGVFRPVAVHLGHCLAQVLFSLSLGGWGMGWKRYVAVRPGPSGPGPPHWIGPPPPDPPEP